MTTLTEAAAACCACLRVHWVETHHPDGTTSGRWLCTQCGNEFAPGSQADAGTFRQLLEVLGREVGKTGESEGAVDVAERVLAERNAARADLATAANVITHLQQENAALLNAFPEYGSTGNELREERERTGKLLNVLHRNGFRECDIAACNCGSWHAGPNLRAEKLQERVDELEAWQLEVAEGMGYVNRAEGQDGYEVASSLVIATAWQDMVGNTEAAVEGELTALAGVADLHAKLGAMREALEPALVSPRWGPDDFRYAIKRALAAAPKAEHDAPRYGGAPDPEEVYWEGRHVGKREDLMRVAEAVREACSRALLVALRAELAAEKAAHAATRAELRVAHAACGSDELRQLLVAAEKERDALKEALVKHCNGRITVPCSFCGDSTFDHECNDRTIPCHHCAALADRETP